MNANGLGAGAKSAFKVIFWVAVAAAVQAAIDQIPNVKLPLWAVPLIAAALKGLATYVSIEIQANKP